MSHDTKLVSSFLLKVDHEQAQKIDDFRWAHRQPSPAAAVRKLLEMGLEAAARQERQSEAA